MCLGKGRTAGVHSRMDVLRKGKNRRCSFENGCAYGREEPPVFIREWMCLGKGRTAGVHSRMDVLSEGFVYLRSSHKNGCVSRKNRRVYVFQPLKEPPGF